MLKPIPVLFALMLICACGATSAPAADRDREPLETRHEKRARTLAPDLYLLADRARDEAQGSRQRGELRAALDHDARAELLEQAARAEAERIELEREGAHAERRFERALIRAARYRRETQRIELETELLVAARRAREQARLILGQRAEQQRSSGSKRERASGSLDRDRDFLLGRARLLLAAAVTLEAKRGPVREAERAIQRAVKAETTAAVSLRRAREALRAAERALDYQP